MRNMHRTSTCEMIVSDKATPSSRTEALSTPEHSIRISSSKHVRTKTSLMFGMQLDGITSFPLRSMVLDSTPSNFFALFGRWKTFAGHLDFNKRWPISLDQAWCGFNRHEFWGQILSQLSMASLHLGATIFIIQLFGGCTSG